MPNYRAMARRAAARAGLDPDIFERQIQQESGFNPNARSPAGAAGIAQIMPGTAKSWGVNAMDPEAALNAAARNMAGYVKKYGGYENALRAYNAGPGAIERSKGFAETNNYVRTILKGQSPKTTTTTSGGSDGSETTPGASITVGTPVEQFAQPERPKVQVTAPTAPAFTAGLALPKGYQETASASAPAQERFDVGKAVETIAKLSQPTTIEFPGVDDGSSSSAGGGSSSSGGGSLFTPGGSYAGTTKPLTRLAQIAHNAGLTTTSAKRATTMTASGNVSDHYAGNKTANARDLSGSVPAMDSAAVQLARKLGIPYKKGQKLEATKVIDGIRYQILYRTNTGGNHFDHIHIGAKRQ